MLSLQDLLNPVNDTSEVAHRELSAVKDDVWPQLQILSSLASSGPINSLQAPPSVKHALELVVSYFTNTITSHTVNSSTLPTLPLADTQTLNLPPSPQKLLTRHQIPINRQTCLETVFYYPQHTLVEYPETSTTGSIGHIFTVDPACWISPALNFAYSLGGSHGMTPKGRSVTVSLLLDGLGKPVPCREMHTTCK